MKLISKSRLVIGLISIILFLTIFNPINQINGKIGNDSTFTLLIFTNDDSDLDTTNYLLSLRPDTSIFNIEIVDISDTVTINSINSDSTFKDKVLEFWIIVSDVEENSLNSIDPIINEFIAKTIPGLIFTNGYENLPQNLLTKLNILSIAENLQETRADENLTILYPNADNLTEILNTTINSFEIGSMNLDVANLSLTSDVYNVALLDKIDDLTINPKIPLIYKPSFNSSLIVGTFEIKDLEYLQEYKLFNKELLYSRIKLDKYNQQQLSLLDIISSISKYQLNRYVKINGINISQVPDPQQNKNDLQLAGINISGFFRSLPAWTLPASATLGLLGTILLLIRKYWMYFIGLFIAIGTALYIPNRKLDAVQVVHHDSRQRIMDILLDVQEKGETFSNISGNLEIPTPTLLWHLKILEDFDLIKRVKIRREVVVIADEFYNDFNPTLKELELSFKSDQGLIFRDFLKSLDMDSKFTLERVIKVTQWNRKTAMRHLNRLVSLGILIKNPTTRTYHIYPKYFISVKELGTSFYKN